MYNLPPVIGIKGIAGAGKSTIALYLTDRYGYVRSRFAGSLKAMLTAHLRECGIDDAEIERMVDGDLKEVTSAHLGGKSPRYAMQTLGTEWGRQLISPTLWTDTVTSRLDAISANDNGRSVLDDCRFANESDFVHARGGWTIEVINAKGSATTETAHVSEANQFVADFTIHNDGVSLMRLYAEIERALNAYIAPADRNPLTFAA
jgi:hypothetical protein